MSKTLGVSEDHVRYMCHGVGNGSLEVVIKGTPERTAEELAQDLIEKIHQDGNVVNAKMRWAEVHGHVSEQVCRMVSSSFQVCEQVVRANVCVSKKVV